MKKISKILSLLISVIFLLTMETVVFANDIIEDEVENEISTVYIYDEEDFIEFAKKCTLDDYSQNLIVYLENDLDLTGFTFNDIPIFLGTFNGGNHTISGLSEDLSKDYQGLFRQVESGAIVQNLNVEYTRSTSHSFIGGIVAVNYGTIQNCTFNGFLQGTNTIGGICAINYGFLINCQTSGGVFGETQIAGITGDNSGTVIDCENYAEINTDISDVAFTIGTSFLSEYTINDDSVEVLDVGGITGNNTGIIQSSTNYGEVGYPHVGYNIGGIAGMQSGYITDCENYGEVYGRKEVGGIVGQFEPYISTVYSVSKLETLQEEIDTLSALTSDFSENTQTNTSVLNTNVNSLTSSVETSKTYIDDLVEQTEDLLNENIDSMNTISVTVSEAIAELASIMENLKPVSTDIDNIINSLTDETGEAAQAKEYLLIAQEELEKASNVPQTDATAVEMIANMEEINNYIVNGLSALNSASDILTTYMSSSEDIESLTENIENSYDMMQDLITDLSENEEVTFTKVDENYNEMAELLSDSLSDVIDNVDNINLSLNTSLDTALEDFDAINVQLNVVLGLLIDIIQDVSLTTDSDYFTVDDSSYENIDDITSGKISDCSNFGVIDGDINVGGISGAISFEYSFDMEDDYKDATQTSSNSGFAVIVNCENTGDITAKTDYVGGIVGLQDFGYIFNSSSVADVQSTSGSYVGGIVGSSTALIDSCYSKNNLSGTQYIGGIVGSGVSVKNCYSLSEITGTDGNIGGIAGNLTSNGIMANNFFVSDTLGGLNGISYKGKAESISYDELIWAENMLDIFENFTVEFFVEDVKIDEIIVGYGDDIDESQLTIIPDKDGYYGMWEEFIATNITSDLKINGVYVPVLTTISGSLNETGIATVLADGTFTNTDTLIVEQTDMEYTIWVDGDNTDINIIRFLSPIENVTIQLEQDGQWVNVDTTLDGLYLHIPVNTDGAVHIRVVTTAVNHTVQLLIIAGALLLSLIMIIGLYLRKSHRQGS